MYVLLKMGIFQPAMLVYQRVMAGDPRHLSPMAAQRTWRYWNVESPADLEVLAPPETKNGFLRKHFGRSRDLKKQLYIYISYRYIRIGGAMNNWLGVAKTVVHFQWVTFTESSGFPMVFQCLGIGPKAY